MIKKILIANRGEIAVRIVRACAEMGIRSVAIYSDADRHALHVKRADEAHSIGAEPLAGYLHPRKLVNLAVETGCDALHPGYGFLSENAELADICAERGIKFIGPSAEVFLEKCIVNPKHIEAQILGDSFGNVVHLFERDCSIQRRN
ncbi:MAG: biotin carboxylase N-terminal domain-containing protein, partial [Pseudomonas sp.]